MSISNASLLVDMNISVWGAQKVDKTVSDEVAHEKQATNDSGKFQKNLMAGTSARKEIADFAAQCRLWHISRTLPWSDKGTRLLPVTMFLDYKAEVNERRDKFERMTYEFIRDYDKHVANAKLSLGDLFNEWDYPDPAVVRAKFGFRTVFSPVPEAGDFRIDTGEADLAELREQYETAFEDRTKEAMQSAWDKLHDMLKNMSSKLAEDDAGKKKIYHETFVTNAQDLCQLLTHLNVTKDPALERARQQLESSLYGVDILDIRGDAGVRADMKQQVDKVIGDFW